VFLRARQVANACRSDVSVFPELFAFDYIEPSIDGHALDAAAAALTVYVVSRGRPIVFRRDCIGEVDAAVDELRRRQHALSAFDEFIVRLVAAC
jgi:hypothetical protein